jgi:hypothetical protein
MNVCIPVGYNSVFSNWVQFIGFQLGTVQCVPVGYSSVCSSWVQFSVFQLGTFHCVPFGYSSVCSSWVQFSVFQLGTVQCVPVGYSSVCSSWVHLTPSTTVLQIRTWSFPYRFFLWFESFELRLRGPGPCVPNHPACVCVCVSWFLLKGLILGRGNSRTSGLMRGHKKKPQTVTTCTPPPPSGEGG